MNTPEYFEKWVRAKNQPILKLTQQEAFARHAAGEPYVAVVQDDGARRVVDIAGQWVSVMFFDEAGRCYLTYDFKRAEPDRLFLSLARHLEYQGESNRPNTSITFAFKPEGAIVIERRNLDSGECEEKDSHGDPSANWEAYPGFGNYHSICRVSR